MRSGVSIPFELGAGNDVAGTEGVTRRASGSGLRARLAGRGDAGGNAGSLRVVLSGPWSIGDAGAGETEVEVVGVVAVISVVDMLMDADSGDAGPESMRAGGTNFAEGVMSDAFS